MKGDRRQFIKISAGTIGTVVAAEPLGLGLDTAAAQEKAEAVSMKKGKQTPSLCPYCSVGCAQIVVTDEAGKIIDIQGNPDSPLSEGTLCPKGAATYQLVVNGLGTACAKACPTGSITFGDIPDLKAKAGSRLAQLRKLGQTKANIYGYSQAGGLKVFYLLMDKPEVYGLPENPVVPQRKTISSFGTRFTALLAGLAALISLRERGCRETTDKERTDVGQ